MEPAASAKTPSLAWKWILEKLLDTPDFGLPSLDGLISSHISDIEEPHCQPLLKRVALRVLEEMIVRNQINSYAIPLLNAITGKNLHPRSIGLSIKQRFDKELVLRVQTEVVLSVLRKDLDEGEKDWAFYESELERVFGEAEEDNRLLDRKWELRALLEPKNQTKVIVTAYFRKFSLNKLRTDLRSFIDEKRETFDTMFLNQLSLAFLDTNGKPFSEDLGGVEKSTTVEANAKQDHVGIVNGESLQELGERGYQYLGQNPKVSVTEDQHMVPGTSMVSGKKRRWEHLSTQITISDDDSEEADEGLAGMKKPRKSKRRWDHLSTQITISDDDSEEADEGFAGMKKPRKSKRRWDHLSTQITISDDDSEEADEGFAARMKKSRESPATPIVNPVKTLLLQCVSEPEVRTSGPQLDCFPVKKEVESTKQGSLLKRGEEPLSLRSNLGQDVMRRSSSAVAHESTGIKVPLSGPSRADQCFISDSETQVAQKLSTDGKDRLIEKDNGDKHNKRGAQSFSENGSDRGHPQGIVESEFLEETIILQRIRKIPVDRRKEASTGSPEDIVHQQEDNERFVTKNELKTLGSQDIYEIEFREVGCDGHEEVCHVCGKHGKLLWCEGCPMSMHFDCIKVLGLKLPKSEEWRCPICLLLKAEREAAEAEKVAVAAKDELQVFKMESEKMKVSPLRHSRQEDGISSPQSEENDRVLKPKQESDEEPSLGYTEGQHFNLTGPALSEAANLRSGRCKKPGLRRTPLPWTREEEEVLKGVYLSRNGAWGGNRWIRILEFGQGAFDPSRTPVDVKDK